MFIIKDNVLVKYKGIGGKIVIPGNVKTIGEQAFIKSKIEELHIPVSVTFIDYYAFDKCKKINKVYYEGSVNQFNKIIIGEFNDKIFMADAYYFKDEVIK